MNVHFEPGFTATQSHFLLQMFPWHWMGSLSFKQTCRCQLVLPRGHSQRPGLGPRGKGTQDSHLLPALSGSSSTLELSFSFLDKLPQGPSREYVYPAYSSSAVPCGLWSGTQNPSRFGPCWPFQPHWLPALSLTCTPSAELGAVSWHPSSLSHSCVFAQGAGLDCLSLSSQGSIGSPLRLGNYSGDTFLGRLQGPLPPLPSGLRHLQAHLLPVHSTFSLSSHSPGHAFTSLWSPWGSGSWLICLVSPRPLTWKALRLTIICNHNEQANRFKAYLMCHFSVESGLLPWGAIGRFSLWLPRLLFKCTEASSHCSSHIIQAPQGRAPWPS